MTNILMVLGMFAGRPFKKPSSPGTTSLEDVKTIGLRAGPHVTVTNVTVPTVPFTGIETMVVGSIIFLFDDRTLTVKVILTPNRRIRGLRIPTVDINPKLRLEGRRERFWFFSFVAKPVYERQL